MKSAKRKNFLSTTILLVLCLLLISAVERAYAGRGEIRVAVATNFIRTMDEFAHGFEKESGIRVKRSSSATGMLYSQIINGAPYDLFLAADAKRPELLHRQGVCDKPFAYADGRVVLWSSRKDLDEAQNWLQVLVRDDIQRIALANPATAPYGEAAMQALAKAGLIEQVDKRLVYGQNVGQAFQYGQQGAADLAFVSRSFALSEQGQKGKTWPLPEAPPVVQKACLLKNSKNKDSVRDLIAYLQTEQAKTILSEFGYE
ncbi:MAG: molybdate ABC transporter substrate-binding protein [Desulfobulbales bacterium]|nr:molybdate ABC transporter substrate-binding protein [Desulfobulbales bacterium]